MADAKSGDPKRSGPENKATVSTGPVKPPVLDMQARSADKSEAPKPDNAKVRDEAIKTETVKPGASKPAAAPNEQGRGFSFGAALAGGVLGLAAAYGLAWSGYWPSAAVAVAPADPRLAQFGTDIGQLQTVRETTQSALALLDERVAALEETPSAALDAVQADMAALSARIDGLGSEPQGGGTTVGDVAALQNALAGLDGRVDANETGLQTLETEMGETSAALAQQSTMGAVLHLPLALSGLETAFASGRPYEAELVALQAALPEIEVPPAIAAGAADGLVRPDIVAGRFEAVLPAMLASQPANPNANWQDGALDWLRSSIALRPTGELPGDSPEAVVSRLEGAIARRDYEAAETLMAALPQAMQAAAAEVPGLIHARAEARRFLAMLRTQALSGDGSAQ